MTQPDPPQPQASLDQALPPRAARRWAGLSADLLITLALLGLMVVGLIGVAAATGWEETLASLAVLGPGQIALLLALSLANYGLRMVRWHMYCRVLGIDVLWRQSFRHYLGGFALTVTPGRVGELIRLRWIRQETGAPLERGGPVLVVDRAADLAAMGLLIGVAVAFSTIGPGGALPVAVLALGAAVVVTRASLLEAALTLGWRLIGGVAGRFSRLVVRSRRAARAMGPFSEFRVLVPALALGGLGWFAEGYGLYLLLGWMGADVSLWTAVGIFLIAMITGGVTGAPGGLGGAEAAMVALLALQGVPLEVSIPATAVSRLTTLWFAIAIGLAVLPFATRYAAHAQARR